MKRLLLYFRRFNLKTFNVWLVLAVMALNIYGILVVSSADSAYKSKEIIGMVGGCIVMMAVAFIDYNLVVKYRWIIYGVMMALLLSVLIFGDEGGGATRWIDLGFIRFQPSEMVKILIILYFSAFFMLHQLTVSTWRTFGIAVALIAVPLALIFKEPDLSTTIVSALIFISLLFCAGLSYKMIGTLLAIFVPLAGIFFYLITREGQTILHEYQYGRIMSFFHPEEYADQWYQQENSMMAIGSGGLMGKGLNTMDAMSVKNGNYISEPHTDFIFAIVGEELGFAGTFCLILLLFFVVLLCILIAKRAKNLTGRLICVGFAAYIGFQSFVNIAVVTGLMPNTGLPLPFISYGLTSLISSYVGVGFVLNVSMQPNKR